MAVTLRGYARSSEGDPIVGALAEAIKEGDTLPTETALTGSDGSWEFIDLPNGAYRVYVTYDNQKRQVDYDNAVQFGMIVGPDGVTAPLPSESVTSTHLRAGSVTGSKLAVGSVLTDALAEGAVTGEKIAEHAITGEHLAPNAVTADSIAPGAITGDKIGEGAGTVRAVRPSAVERETFGPYTSPNVDRLVWVKVGTIDPLIEGYVGFVHVHLRLECLESDPPSMSAQLRFREETVASVTASRGLGETTTVISVLPYQDFDVYVRNNSSSPRNPSYKLDMRILYDIV